MTEFELQLPLSRRLFVVVDGVAKAHSVQEMDGADVEQAEAAGLIAKDVTPFGDAWRTTARGRAAVAASR